MSRREKREEKVKSRIILKLFVVAILLAVAFFILKMAPNYINNEIIDKANLIINNSNVTKDLKKDIIIEDGVIYVAKEDIENFFDPYIYYDEKYNQIITTYGSKITSIIVGENSANKNGAKVEISGTVLERDNTYYIPFSSLSDTYNVEINYIEETNTVVADSLDRRYVVATSMRDDGVKAYPTMFSRNVDKVEQGENVVVVQNEEGQNNVIDEWTEVRTNTGKLGYVKTSILTNELEKRQTIEEEKQIDGKVSMVWDYFTNYVYPPDRSDTNIKGVNVVSPTFFTLVDEGKGAITENVFEQGKAYIEWAHSKGYMVWPSVSNNSYIETTSEIMRDYNYRHDLIENIVSLVLKYDLDGINIDFEYMHDEDKELFSRFIIELKPRLSEIGAVLSVDVTAPDGSEEWSMCYDRHVIGDVADYIVFMAYDQYGQSSTTAGPNSAYDWVRVNVQKFLGQEGVEADKLILGLPFYTRLWKDYGDRVEKTPIYMNSTEKNIPAGAERRWDDDLKLYYVEFVENGVTNKIWIEDEESIEAKLSLIEEYNLAGAAYWALGWEIDEVWNTISDSLGIE